MTHKVLRLPDVMDRVGLGSSFIYLLIQREEFPKPVRLGKRAVGWPEAEVNAWLEERLAERGELY
jgi:prophage regulatory protein